MSDLIDRQQAIDAYGDWYVEEGTEDGFIGTVKQLLEGFPSAQLGTDLAEVGTDCISRQAAIEVVQNRHMMLSKEKVLLINDLEKLPSAQPTFDARDTQYNLPIGTDTISRAQAINEIWDGTNYDIYTREVKEILEKLPSAQPEIIKCMECKYYEASIACNPWGVCCHKDWVANNVGHTVDEAGWCYRAER